MPEVKARFTNQFRSDFLSLLSQKTIQQLVDDTVAWLRVRIENDPLYTAYNPYTARRAYATSITMPIFKAQIEQLDGVCLRSNQGYYFTRAPKADEVETMEDLEKLEGLYDPTLTFLAKGMMFPSPKEFFGDGVFKQVQTAVWAKMDELYPDND